MLFTWIAVPMMLFDYQQKKAGFPSILNTPRGSTIRNKIQVDAQSM
jgi:hypothetical protein